MWLQGLVGMSDGGSLSTPDSSLSSDDSSFSSDIGRSTNQAEELANDVKRLADKGWAWAASSSADVPSRTTGGFTTDSAAGSTKGDNHLPSGGGASISESVCEASTSSDSIIGSSRLTSTISESISDDRGCTDGDSELDGGAACSNSSSTGFSNVNTGLAVAPHTSTGVPGWCADIDADSIKVS